MTRPIPPLPVPPSSSRGNTHPSSLPPCCGSPSLGPFHHCHTSPAGGPRKVSSLKSRRRCGSPPPPKNQQQKENAATGPEAPRNSSCQTPPPSLSRTSHMLFSCCRLTALTSRVVQSPHLLPPTKTEPNKTQQPTRESLIVSSGTYQSGRSFVALLDQTDRQPDRQTATLQASPLRPWAPGRRSAKCGENRSSRGKRVSTGQLQQSQRSGADGRSRLAPPVAVLLYCYWWWAKREGRNQPLSPELTKPHLFFCSVFGNVHTWS